VQFAAARVDGPDRGRPPEARSAKGGAHLYSFENLYRAWRECRRNKRNTANALAFEIDAEANLLRLRDELLDGSYCPGRSICFVTDGPKPREVFAADFRDRVVHHLLVRAMEPLFERRFIHDSYACRAGKGVLAASERLTQFLRQATANGRRPASALRLDVASFFPSIRKDTLFALLARYVRDPEVLRLARVVVFHDPTQNYSFRWKRRHVPPPWDDEYPVPTQKSLFDRGNERGLPIGNLTSQFWANVYLNEVDQFVKRELHCPWYVRYVDDMVLLDHDAAELVGFRELIKAFLNERLGLQLRDPDMEPQPVRDGVLFVGWRTWWSHRVPRRQTLQNLEQRLDRYERLAVRPAWGGSAQCVEVDRRDVHAATARLRSVLASYGGHLRHGAAFGVWQTAWRRGWLQLLFRRDGWRAIERWPVLRSLTQPRFAQQYRRLLRHAGDDVPVFCQVGRFVELYGPQRLAALWR